MSESQYLKTIEKEIAKLNRIIDEKIVRGEVYKREARDHKLLLKKVRYINRQNFFRKLFPTFSSAF